ncbi:MAG TPA: divergent PAP2 family protein [Anaerolineaceae bacterium]|nr:divergent PAP2 family protein [Anaerolineaceae bacterium]HPN52312.1 divergent PAP2 family protein [Anaerolineaceae bacterium]
MSNPLDNPTLIAGLIGWFLAQTLKLPINYMRTRKWNWALWFGPGGMPSSHSSIITAATTSIGLFEGFDSPLFALAFLVAMVITYDAAGVRRQAGFHAKKINIMINELFTGQPLSQEKLKEVIGHTPREVAAGVALGIVIGLLVWLVWPKST